MWSTLQVLSNENSQHGPTEFEYRYVSIQKESRNILSLKVKLDCSQWYTMAYTCFFTFNLDPNLTLTLGSMSHKMLPEYLHHVTYAPAKFEVATANGLGGHAFTRKYII